MSMIRNKFKTFITLGFFTACVYFTSCSLQEYNPSGYTMESVSKSSVSGYKTIINSCYYGWEQRMYACQYWMLMAEGGTDIWTTSKNGTGSSQYLKYDLGSGTKDNTFKDQWGAFYDGIGYCNTAISLADLAPFKSEAEKNALVAEAHFLRAIYYYQLLEQYGDVTLTLKPPTDINIHPEKTKALDIYKQAILPDLEFAAQWLPITNDLSRPSKKSAMGFLALAYLQSVEYDNTKFYADSALSVSKRLIADCEAGGTTYNTYMYPSFKDVFDTLNNFPYNIAGNKEALWEHRFVYGANPRNPEQCNENDLLFNCSYTGFGALVTNYFAWGGRSGGQFMPTEYLLNTFVQDDGSLDPRYHQSFRTYWPCNKAYTWTTGNITTFDKSSAVTATTKLNVGDTAIVLVHPNDANYSTWMAKKRDSKYMVVDLANVYTLDPIPTNQNPDTVRMYYQRAVDGKISSNPFLSFYPSLLKHFTAYKNQIEVQANKKYANVGPTFAMRMSEVYLIAAEADLYKNNGINALTYLNKIRARAGARPLSGAVTVQTILDERARELCGEYTRWNDLKRTGNLTQAYLMAKNPDVGKYFKDEKNKVRQIPLNFLQTLENGGMYYQNPNY